MLAIPSPDVLLNLFASGAQVLGLLVLALGGGFLSRRRLQLDAGQRSTVSRWPFRIALLLLVAVSSAFVLYHLGVVDANNQRLRANLVRASTEAGKKVGDTSLKTLSYSGQKEHPRGIPTEQLEQWIADGEPLNLIDVREPEEVEMGAIPGSWARRYPDLQANPAGLQVEGRRTILLCESGNRSSELCDWFWDQGLLTRFMIGGYEKWVAENRPMVGARSDLSDSSDIRATPDYPKKQVLLDTPEVLELLTNENALLVDVRYPEDFERGHLPGAVNVPLRKMQMHEVEAALAALPARPIVAACYDKRSSFYGLLLGLRLHRLGADFRGRYTVPHEFPNQKPDAEWVTRWRAEREGKSLFATVNAGLVGLVQWLDGRCGLGLAVVLLVLLLRAVMLPFSLLGERDQWRQRRLRPQLLELRRRHAGDPELVRRTQLRWLREARISPLRNLLGSILQLFLFAFAFSAVDEVAGGSAARWLWTLASEADPFAVLPLLFGVAMLLFVRLQQQRSGRWLWPLLFAVAMTALVWQLRAAVQVYLLLSIGSMALQTLLHRAWLARGDRSRAAGRPAPARLIELRQAAAHPELGNKALRLGRLLQAGLPVPAGFVVPWGLEPDQRALASACRRAGIGSAAARSSAEGEDGAAQSMAGMFRTELDVPVHELHAAIAAVRASYGERRGGVVVQSFCRADHAGVLFTVDPAHAGRMLVEMVAGGGDALVSGRTTPQTIRFGRVTGQRLASDAAPPIDLAELIELGRAVERLFGRPQDIEWVHAGGRFQLVQSRDITRTAADLQTDDGIREQERARLLAHLRDVPAGEEPLVQTEVAELLPAPTTYSLSLFESLWAAGGTVDLACRTLGFPYDVVPGDRPYIVPAFGRCYVDQREGLRRTRRQMGPVASFRLAAAAQSLADELRASLPSQRRAAARLEALDLERLPLDELLVLAEETRVRFQQQTYVRAEMINLAAEFFVGAARRQTQKRGLDAAAALRDGQGNVVSAAFAVLAGDGPIDARVDDFLRAFGHRAAHDFELAEPRYRESPERVAALAGASGQGDRAAVVGEAYHGVLGLAIERARQSQRLKEEAKHEAMRELAVLRRLLLAIGERCGLGQQVFDLEPAEVARLGDPAFSAAAGERAAQRRRRREVLLAVPLPATLSPVAIERLDDQQAEPQPAGENLHGVCVAGSHDVVGRVRVLHDAADLARLRPGDILVTRCTDPCWLPAFAIAGGLVTEIGGWLSHAAIQARERDLPTIVSAVGCTRRLRDGELVRLCRDGTIVQLAELRERHRHRVDFPATLHGGGMVVQVRVLDLNRLGAGIEVSTRSLATRAEYELQFAEVRVRAELAWANCQRIGLRFVQPLALDQDSPLQQTG